MIEHRRPAPPEGFRDAAHIATEDLHHRVREGETLVFDEQIWQRHKALFAAAQHSKCAFCDRRATTDDPHVDHFRPKSELWELSEDPGDRGLEIHDGLPNIRGRRAARKTRGYYWLAHEWTNYLLICGTCNSKWKQCYFPVISRERQWPPAPDEPLEPPLLLNPFDDKAPWRCFVFDCSGHIAETPGSEKGRATIETCGLDRQTLQSDREGVAGDAYDHARTIAKLASAVLETHTDDGDRAEFRYALRSLCRIGGRARAHAGLVRSIAEQETGLLWEHLEKLRSLWAPEQSPDVT